MRNKQPVYLKRKDPTNNNNEKGGTPEGPRDDDVSYGQTQANENEEVVRSELQSLRQSAVSMSVSEKAGATQIVQDWLDDGSSDQNENKEEAKGEEEKKE